jgi:hypothetical protein
MTQFGLHDAPPLATAKSLTTHDVDAFYLCRDQAPHMDATLWPTLDAVDAMIVLRLWTPWPTPAACGGFRDQSPLIDAVADPAARTWWML